MNAQKVLDFSCTHTLTREMFMFGEGTAHKHTCAHIDFGPCLLYNLGSLGSRLNRASERESVCVPKKLAQHTIY